MLAEGARQCRVLPHLQARRSQRPYHRLPPASPSVCKQHFLCQMYKAEVPYATLSLHVLRAQTIRYLFDGSVCVQDSGGGRVQEDESELGCV